MTQPLEQTAAPDAEDRILESLRRIIRAIDLHSRHLAQRHTLTGPQLVCLRALRRHGPLAPGALAKQVSLSPATVTGIVDRLERRGLITRVRRVDDKRKAVLTLTALGQQLVEQAPAPLHAAFAKRLAELPVEEQEEIDRVLARVVTMMETPVFVGPLDSVETVLTPPLSPFLDSGEALVLSPSATDTDGRE